MRNEKVKQIIGAAGWWAQYLDSDTKKFFYKKLIAFGLTQDEDGYSGIEPIDSYGKDTSPDFDQIEEISNFVSIFYRPGFQKKICNECAMVKNDCECLKPAVD